MPNPLDENKTPLTHRVTAVAAAYLDSIGCKPVETEVAIASGWVADVASFWYPTRTEGKKLHLTEKAKSILAIDGSFYNGFHRVYGPGPLTVAVEVKITRADFARDAKWNRPAEAHICALAFPCGVIEPDEIPNGWYGLETSKDGTSLRKVHRHFGCVHPQHPGLVLDFVAAVAIRRDHRTRYRAMKDWQKAYRARDAEKKRQYSASRLLEGVANWIQREGWKRSGLSANCYRTWESRRCRHI